MFVCIAQGVATNGNVWMWGRNDSHQVSQLCSRVVQMCRLCSNLACIHFLPIHVTQCGIGASTASIYLPQLISIGPAESSLPVQLVSCRCDYHIYFVKCMQRGRICHECLTVVGLACRIRCWWPQMEHCGLVVKARRSAVVGGWSFSYDVTLGEN